MALPRRMARVNLARQSLKSLRLVLISGIPEAIAL
jgi:hypothetical protein